MRVSVIIPAFNEERFLPETIDCLQRAVRHFGGGSDGDVEIIVADNASTDQTAAIAVAAGAKVVPVPEHNIARVRNVGAAASTGDLLVFVDADTLVPETLLTRIVEVTSETGCVGGAVDTDYRPARALVRMYLQMWRLLGHMTGMAQGATQFCRREAFVATGGYDETLYMGEDVDFYWRLRRLARSAKGHVELLKDIRVVPSCRRVDQWPLWRTLVETSPLFILLLRRRKFAWKGWYGDVPR